MQNGRRIGTPLLVVPPPAALFALKGTGLNNNFYVQIGLVLLMTLSARNAILIL